MFERFSPEGMRAIIFAQEEARHYWHTCLEPEDLLLGIVKSQSNSYPKWYHGLTETAASKALTSFGISLDAVRTLVKPGKQGTFIPVEIPFSPAVKAILKTASQIADSENDQLVKTHHLVFALLQDTANPLRQIMNLKAIEAADLAAELTNLLNSGEYVEERRPEQPPKLIVPFGHSIKMFFIRKLYAWLRVEERHH